jgi:hydroxylaminobenzene mutase
MTGSIAADPGEAVSAHLNALLGSFWMLGVAWTLPFVSYGDVGQRRLAWTLVVANFANWSVTVVKARLHVKGIALGPPVANNAVFAALNALVVIPSLAAALAWIVGLHRGRSDRAAD